MRILRIVKVKLCFEGFLKDLGEVDLRCLNLKGADTMPYCIYLRKSRADSEAEMCGAGSAIFLHCLGDRKPRTGGCVAIPEEQMYFVMRHVDPGCVVVIDSMDNFGAAF